MNKITFFLLKNMRTTTTITFAIVIIWAANSQAGEWNRFVNRNIRVNNRKLERFKYNIAALRGVVDEYHSNTG